MSTPDHVFRTKTIGPGLGTTYVVEVTCGESKAMFPVTALRGRDQFTCPVCGVSCVMGEGGGDLIASLQGILDSDQRIQAELKRRGLVIE